MAFFTIFSINISVLVKKKIVHQYLKYILQNEKHISSISFYKAKSFHFPLRLQLEPKAILRATVYHFEFYHKERIGCKDEMVQSAVLCITVVRPCPT